MKHFKSPFLTLFALTFTFALTACGGSGVELSETFVNEEAGIQMDYPQGHEVQENVNGLLVAFSIPRENNIEDTFRENMVLAVQDLAPEEVTLEEFNEANLEQTELLSPGFELDSSEKITFAGSPGYKHIYSSDGPIERLKFLNAWSVIDNIAYVYIYTADVDSFDEYLAEAQAMLESIEFME